MSCIDQQKASKRDCNGIVIELIEGHCADVAVHLYPLRVERKMKRNRILCQSVRTIISVRYYIYISFFVIHSSTFSHSSAVFM